MDQERSYRDELAFRRHNTQGGQPEDSEGGPSRSASGRLVFDFNFPEGVLSNCDLEAVGRRRHGSALID